MTSTSYVLKSQRGTPVYSTNAIELARTEQAARKARNVTTRLFEVQTVEREI